MFTTIKKIAAGLFCATALFSTNLMAIQFSIPGKSNKTMPLYKKNMSCTILPRDTIIYLRIQGISGWGEVDGEIMKGRTAEIPKKYFNKTIQVKVLENSIVKIFNDIPETVTADCTILPN